MKYLIPILFFSVFIYACFKKVNVYQGFTSGVKKAIPLAVDIFPYLVSIFVLTELFEASGLSNLFIDALSPCFRLLGIPKELTKLILVKPFSGSGALALLSEIYSTYGVDGYLARCASVIYGSSETVFYIAAVYFSGGKKFNLFKPIIISLVASFCSIVFACFICKIL